VAGTSANNAAADPPAERAEGEAYSAAWTTLVVVVMSTITVV
jgi:hypothetical protein